MTQDKRRGCLFGAAFGDALGAEAEFKDAATIRLLWPPHGPTALEGHPARVTDDTQMMLAFGRALHTATASPTDDELSAAILAPLIRAQFVAWSDDPDNNRAPGRTCLIACGKLRDGLPWLHASVRGSKGCGSNMRVMPAAFIAAKKVAPVAQLQAGMTHGHPTGLVAADATATALRLLVQGTPATKLLDALERYATTQRRVYHYDWLGTLWQRPGATDAEHFIERGWDEQLAALARVRAGLGECGRLDDPCPFTGDGWVAEEALASALLCFLLQPEAPLDMLRQAATTRGDSDSIDCIAGALAGAYLGSAAWPAEWFGQIEYAAELERLSSQPKEP